MRQPPGRSRLSLPAGAGASSCPGVNSAHSVPLRSIPFRPVHLEAEGEGAWAISQLPGAENGGAGQVGVWRPGGGVARRPVPRLAPSRRSCRGRVPGGPAGLRRSAAAAPFRAASPRLNPSPLSHSRCSSRPLMSGRGRDMAPTLPPSFPRSLRRPEDAT